MQTNENELISANPLSLSRKNIYSQFGEDGVIGKIFSIIKDQDHWCVEFGASDGITGSNTYNLINNFNWNGVLIEADSNVFKKLKETYNNSKNVTLINKFVEFEGKNVLDSILQETNIPKNFDLLSIDIDGNDYYIWNSVKQFKPKVVLIEFNQTIPNHIDFIQKKDVSVHHGSSILSFVKLGKKLGYELVATTDINAFFVEKSYFDLFGITDNSLEKLRDIHKYETTFFQLYDGTIVLDGYNKLFWHDMEFKNKKFQLLPKMFRVFPQSSLNGFQYFLYRIYKKFYKIF
jgi:hypothetical protein